MRQAKRLSQWLHLSGAGRLSELLRRPQRILIENHTQGAEFGAGLDEELGAKVSAESADAATAVSLRRAEAVKNYLLNHEDFLPEEITAIGYGSTRPLDHRQNTRAKLKNRRFDIYVEPENQTIRKRRIYGPGT